MSSIGENIKKYRLQKGYTQDKLGREVGVTTQAVSKWERGSTPDAEILPLIADALDISIDALFGREEMDMQLTMTKKLSTMASADAFRHAFNFCWSIILGLTGEVNFTEDFIDTFTSHTGVKRDICPDYFAKVIRDDGIAMARMSNDFSHFFLMVQPQDESVLAHFESQEAIRQVFVLFSDKKILKIVYYLYTKSSIPVTEPLICSGTGLEPHEVARCMKTLCDRQIVYRMKIATTDGDIDTYSIRSEADVFPMLCFADEIAKGCPFSVFNLYDRKLPIF